MNQKKERPIIFSTPMVQAILAGNKTQTRRILKPQPVLRGRSWIWKKCSWTADSPHCATGNLELAIDRCPFGRLGYRLWVREKLLSQNGVLCYADGTEVRKILSDGLPGYIASEKGKPSIHMPRWVSRLTLEITNVKVECLNDISEEDAKAEGIEVHPAEFNIGVLSTAIFKFKGLWESINGAGSWENNPWVWVIEFRRLNP